MVKPLQNLHLQILSLAAAIVLWVFVVGIENSVYKFPDVLDVQAANLDKNVSLTSDLPQVKIYIKDDKDIISTLTKNDFIISADFSGLKSGEHMVSISAVAKNPQVRILKIEPNEINVKLSPSAEKEVKVVANITGAAAPGYEAKDFKLEFEKAKILGAQANLDLVNSLEANLVLNGTETENISQNISLTLPEKNSVIDGKIMIVPEQVLINLSIVPKKDQKRLTVQAKLAGIEDDSVWQQMIKIVPSSVQLEGDEKSIKALDNILTGPIEVSQLLNQDGPLKVELDLPAGVKIVDGSNYVTVSIRDETIERKTMTVPVSLSGAANGFKVTKVNPASVSVTVTGRSTLINNLKAGDVSIALDLSKINSLGPVQIQTQDIKIPLGLKVMDYRPGDINLE